MGRYKRITLISRMEEYLREIAIVEGDKQFKRTSLFVQVIVICLYQTVRISVVF